jgi:hypothetical protein
VKYEAVITCRTGVAVGSTNRKSRVQLSGGKDRQTTATVYGSWAVHRSLDPRSREWAITHVPSGLAIPREHTSLLTKAQAIEVAKAADAAFGALKVTRQRGAIILQFIHNILTRDTRKAMTPGELQHLADVAEGCP